MGVPRRGESKESGTYTCRLWLISGKGGRGQYVFWGEAKRQRADQPLRRKSLGSAIAKVDSGGIEPTVLFPPLRETKKPEKSVSRGTREARRGLGGTHVLLRPPLPLAPNFRRQLFVSVLPVRIPSEERHDIVEVRVVHLDGDVARKGEGGCQRCGTRKGRKAYWTQGCIRSLYHSGNRVDLRTVAFIDMRRWNRPLQPERVKLVSRPPISDRSREQKLLAVAVDIHHVLVLRPGKE